MRTFEDKLSGATDFSDIGPEETLVTALDLTKKLGKPLKFDSIRDRGHPKVVLVFPGDQWFIFNGFQTGYRGTGPDNFVKYLAEIGYDLLPAEIEKMAPPFEYTFSAEPVSESREQELERLLRIFIRGTDYPSGPDPAYDIPAIAAELGDRAIPMLQRYLEEDLHGRGALAAVLSLQDVSSEMALPLIERAFDSRDSSVRSVAAGCLFNHRSDRAKGIAQQQFQVETDDTVLYRLQAAIDREERIGGRIRFLVLPDKDSQLITSGVP